MFSSGLVVLEKDTASGRPFADVASQEVSCAQSLTLYTEVLSWQTGGFSRCSIIVQSDQAAEVQIRTVQGAVATTIILIAAGVSPPTTIDVPSPSLRAVARCTALGQRARVKVWAYLGLY